MSNGYQTMSPDYPCDSDCDLVLIMRQKRITVENNITLKPCCEFTVSPVVIPRLVFLGTLHSYVQLPYQHFHLEACKLPQISVLQVRDN